MPSLPLISRHEIAEILLKVALKHNKLNKSNKSNPRGHYSYTNIMWLFLWCHMVSQHRPATHKTPDQYECCI